MNRQRLFLSTAARLARKADRAAAYWGVRSAYLAGTRPLSTLSSEDQAILKTRGNPAIRMNDLFKATSREIKLIHLHHPTLSRWAREIDYPNDMWWSDPSMMQEAKPAQLRESWNSARSLAMAAEAADEDDAEDEIDEFVMTRNQSEREEIIALMEAMRARGEDNWTDTEYPVRESQAYFSARGSNDNLDEMFGEEPKDPRTDVPAFDKLRQWAPDRFESFFNSHGTMEDIDKNGHIHEIVTTTLLKRVVPSGDFFSGDDDQKFDGHWFTVPMVTDEFTGKVKRGGFVDRAMFFAERDRLTSWMGDDYFPLPVSKKFAHAKREEIVAKGLRRDYRGWNDKAPPGPMDLQPVQRTAQPAPDRPRLRKGQRHVIVCHNPDGSSVLCAPSEVL